MTIPGIQPVSHACPEFDTPGVSLTDPVSAARPAGPGAVKAAQWESLRAEAALTWARLAPLIAQAPHVRHSLDGGESFPAKGRRPLKPLNPVLPNRPATVPVFDRERGTGHLLVADLDVGRAKALGAGDPAAQVAAEAAALIALIERCGGRALADVSPSGGRHVYVLFAKALPWTELRSLATAMARRFPTMDTVPMSNPGGQIRPPGAPHKLLNGHLTGYMRLTIGLEEAAAIARRPCRARVWERLHDELAAELQPWAPARPEPAPATSPDPDPASLATSPVAGRRVELDADGMPWVRRRGGRGAPRPDLAERARTGDWSGYHSPSEARLAVLNSIAAAGWKFAEVVEEIERGAWGGLQVLLERRSTPEQERVLRGDWQKAIDGIAVGKPASKIDTHLIFSTPPLPPQEVRPCSEGPGEGGKQGQDLYFVDSLTPDPSDQTTALVADPKPLNFWQEIMVWNSAVWAAERDITRRAGWGRATPAIRMLLRAMAVAARQNHTTAPAFGVRWLSLMSGLDHSTVAKHLKALREEPDPLIERIVIGRGKAGDRYQLIVPTAYRAEASWRRWRGGRIETVHPALHHLGATVALTYETLSTAPTGSAELARLALLSPAATTLALRTLAALQLAERTPTGWIRGMRNLDEVATETGADVEQAERLAAYLAERARWHQLLELWSLPPADRPGYLDRMPTEPDLAELVPWPTAPKDDGLHTEPDDATAIDTPPVPVLAAAAENEAMALLQQMLGAHIITPPQPTTRGRPRTPERDDGPSPPTGNARETIFP
ncbi:hypothetical protein SAMN05216276_107845 [Streptosporangium subroseum]|uniref:Uncharacterized protein n=1 Tax=Streptosporangium subroseum TaxID=106412 RepID=A0A239P0K0_9ACTN|nr:hypothetical protein [Streptosporangium subroseum]SNT60667.1 hypothetical protein SAMN05216276_107845 [Streptosporangium subroseum]